MLRVNIDDSYNELLKNVASKYGYVHKEKNSDKWTGNISQFLKDIAEERIVINKNSLPLRIPPEGKLLKLKFTIVKHIRGTVAQITTIIGRSGANIVEIQSKNLSNDTFKYGIIHILMTYPTEISITELIHSFGKYKLKKDMRETDDHIEINTKEEICEAIDKKRFEDVLANAESTILKFSEDKFNRNQVINTYYETLMDRRLIDRIECCFVLLINADDRKGLLGDITSVIAEKRFNTESTYLSFVSDTETIDLEIAISFTEKFRGTNTDINERLNNIVNSIKKIDNVININIKSVGSLL